MKFNFFDALQYDQSYAWHMYKTSDIWHDLINSLQAHNGEYVLIRPIRSTLFSSALNVTFEKEQEFLEFIDGNGFIVNISNYKYIKIEPLHYIENREDDEHPWD